eukprot:9562-Heterococcus_DN1.PRE.4
MAARSSSSAAAERQLRPPLTISVHMLRTLAHAMNWQEHRRNFGSTQRTYNVNRRNFGSTQRTYNVTRISGRELSLLTLTESVLFNIAALVLGGNCTQCTAVTDYAAACCLHFYAQTATTIESQSKPAYTMTVSAATRCASMAAAQYATANLITKRCCHRHCTLSLQTAKVACYTLMLCVRREASAFGAQHLRDDLPSPSIATEQH